ncbi:MAG: YbjN domain-containing protein [Rhodobacterales bacterium]|nr:YbjN domain-containing protein [Rhodobacterales bacterium]
MKLAGKFKGTVAAVVLGLSSGLATTATAEITATDAYEVMTRMQKFGFIASMEADSDGDPKIVSRVSDTKFRVYFYGCENNDNCSSLHFRAGYDLANGITASKMNEWNREKRFAKAYIDDEGDPFLEMDVNLDFEGVGDENFEDSLDWWRLLVEDFEEFIDW